LISNRRKHTRSKRDWSSDVYSSDLIITVHQETCPHLHRTNQLIKNQNVKAAVVINPATPVAMIKEIIANVDLVLVMSVNPGFGGQSFISSTLSKIKEIDLIRKDKQLD